MYPNTVDNTPDLARIAAHHRPFYEKLYAQRLDVAPWEEAERPERCRDYGVQPDSRGVP